MLNTVKAEHTEPYLVGGIPKGFHEEITFKLCMIGQMKDFEL